MKEDFTKIKGAWKVDMILLKGKDITNNFDMLQISFTDWENRVILPCHKELTKPYPVKDNYWRYQRQGIFDGQIEIYQSAQGFFNGK